MTGNAFQESEERQILRQEVAKLASTFGREYISKKIEAGEKTTELWEAIGKAGYLGVNLPEEYGDLVLGEGFHGKSLNPVILGLILVDKITVTCTENNWQTWSNL